MMGHFKTMMMVVLVSVLACGASAPNFMGEETIGNKPFTIHNYKDWPNILPVINNKSRVYHTWVNGDERFYYNTSTDQLNQLLIDYSKLAGKKEVLILPQSENVKTFDQKQNFPFNCSLHLVGGIAKTIAAKNKGSVFWPIDPQLTIRVTPENDLTKLKIPAGVKIISLAEIKARYKDGIDSTDKSVRGWGIGYLVDVDPYDGASLNFVSDLMVDKDDWVALNAISNITNFGPKAKDQLARIEAISKGQIKNNAKRAKDAIPKIKAACEEAAKAEFTERETLFRQQADQAQAFVNRVRGL